ncbi:hypothetical protein [Gimibacter soli]|uniref:Lipoprotein n=1 Tax=Gimibacter soli TaxID=3024400 RepID=A0AAF0BLQ8_9PROT|nr:hypothetical protein [Gimibacter soli]WCL53745.1 hypothetical protein PH603_14485 [Gimibacter soli]
MRLFTAVVAGAGLMLSACTGTTNTPPAAQAPAAPAAPSEEGPAGRIGTLPPQELADGTCGLYLFAREVGRRLVFVSDTTSTDARMQIDGRPAQLTRVSASGTAAGRFFPEMRYEAGGVTVSVSYVPEMNGNLSGGAVIREGRLTFADASGWSYVMPVAGLIACRPAQE